MRKQRLGCLTPLGMVAAVITILAIALTGMAKGGSQFSPGQLSAVSGAALGGFSSHADIGGKCATCHTAPWEQTRMMDQCLACHTKVEADLGNPKTLHGGLVKSETEKNCLKCHTEHHGSDAILTRIDIQNFPHEVTGFSLRAHQKFPDGKPIECNACHMQQFSHVTGSVCQDCHTETEKTWMKDHFIAFGSDCLSCHDGIDRFGKAFDHSLVAFPLQGKHAALNCASCHQNQTNPNIVSSTPQDCASCHRKDDAHNGILGADCSACHTPASWKSSSFDHNQKTVFPLAGKHMIVACTACHTSPDLKATPKDCIACHKSDDSHQGKLGVDCAACHSPLDWEPANFDHNTRTSFKLLGKHMGLTCESCHMGNDVKATPTDCAACHQKEDPHQGKLGKDCAACHNEEGWLPSTFIHTRSKFPLVGKHQQVACTACHQDKTFQGAPTNCLACHQKDDIHLSKLGTDCASCHNTVAWKPSSFNHTHTAFQLVGKHQRVACTACHVDKTFQGAPTSCAGCHQKDDVHKGQLGTNCAICHTPAAWKPSSFVHSTTSFPLVGKHQQVACTSCHKDATFQSTPTSCVSCHKKDDAHQGQLGPDCAICHTPSAWRPSTFNHARTAFPLTGSHQNVPCSACHANLSFNDTSTTCVACHAKDDRHNGQFGTDCAACHTTDRWSNVTFNHNNTGFPLTGAHASLPCSRCHAQAYHGTPTACKACHQEPAIHAGLFLSDCGACHSTSAWLPAQFNGSHTFPMNHGGARSCNDCHVNSLTSFTCYTCHNQNEMIKKHNEKGISDVSNCVACHPNGRKEEGGGD